MHVSRTVYVLLSLAMLASACDVELERTNPNDSRTAVESQSPGVMTGRAYLEGETDHADIEIHFDGPVVDDVSTRADGNWERNRLTPGLYTVTVGSRGWQEQTLTGVQVSLAALTDLTDVTLQLRRAQVEGAVAFADGSYPGSGRVRLSRSASLRSSVALAAPMYYGMAASAETDSTGAVGFSYEAGLEDGEFAVSDVPSGTYTVVVEVEGAESLQTDVFVDGESPVVTVGLAELEAVDITPPDAPVLQRTDLDGDGQSLSATTVELAWSASVDENLAGYVLQRFVEGIDSDFATIATLGPAVLQYTDDVQQLGARHWYRVRAVDASDLVSPWSIVASADPIGAVQTLLAVREGAQDIRYDIAPAQGAYLINSTLVYDNLAGTQVREGLPTNQLSWLRQPPQDIRYNEALEVRAQNADGSLVYNSRFELPHNKLANLPSSRSGAPVFAIPEDDRQYYLEAQSGTGALTLRERDSYEDSWSAQIVSTHTSMWAYALGFPGGATVDVVYSIADSPAPLVLARRGPDGQWRQVASFTTTTWAYDLKVHYHDDLTYITYQDNTQWKCRSWDGAQWRIETVPSANYTSFALSSKGSLKAASYVVSGTSQVILLTRTGFNAWSQETVSSGYANSTYARLTYDSALRPVIIFRTPWDAYTAVKDSSIWRVKKITTTTNGTFYDAQVAVSPDDTTYVVLHDNAGPGLWFFDGTDWSVTDPGWVTANGNSVRIGLNRDARLYAAYYDGSANVARLATLRDMGTDILKLGSYGFIVRCDVDADEGLYCGYVDGNTNIPLVSLSRGGQLDTVGTIPVGTEDMGFDVAVGPGNRYYAFASDYGNSNTSWLYVNGALSESPSWISSSFGLIGGGDRTELIGQEYGQSDVTELYRVGATIGPVVSSLSTEGDSRGVGLRLTTGEAVYASISYYLGQYWMVVYRMPDDGDMNRSAIALGTDSRSYFDLIEDSKGHVWAYMHNQTKTLLQRMNLSAGSPVLESVIAAPQIVYGLSALNLPDDTVDVVLAAPYRALLLTNRMGDWRSYQIWSASGGGSFVTDKALHRTSDQVVLAFQDKTVPLIMRSYARSLSPDSISFAEPF